MWLETRVLRDYIAMIQSLTINLSPAHIITENTVIWVNDRTPIERGQIWWEERSFREVLAPFVDIVCCERRDDGGH